MMFLNIKYGLKTVFINTSFRISHPKLAIFRFFSFLCSFNPVKQNGYEKNYEGNSSPNADDVICGGL